MKPDGTHSQANTTYDVVVVGAGAAGLLAAADAATRGRRVLLLEKNAKPGVKILMSGGTRCNLTQATDAKGIVDAFGRQGAFLHSALATLDPQGLRTLFDEFGVATKVEATGKVFPRSDRAMDVLQALLTRLNRSGANLATRETVLACRPRDSATGSPLFQIETSTRSLLAPRLLITTGGQSYPGCGTTGDGYAWARELGHEVVSPRPALVPLASDDGWVRRLSGLTLADVEIRLARPADARSTRELKKLSQRNSFLFTHQGVSGPAVLDISRLYTLQPSAQTTLICDFLPDISWEEMQSKLRAAARRSGKRRVQTALAEFLPKRLTEELMQCARVSSERTLAEFSREEASRLGDWVKQAAIRIKGTLGFAKAEVTAGGVALAQIHSRTMESKIVPGLFFAGEILDLDGPIGGYNFQAAFATGRLAAQHM